jgi:hypothetical protein
VDAGPTMTATMPPVDHRRATPRWGNAAKRVSPAKPSTARPAVRRRCELGERRHRRRSPTGGRCPRPRRCGEPRPRPVRRRWGWCTPPWWSRSAGTGGRDRAGSPG